MKRICTICDIELSGKQNKFCSANCKIKREKAKYLKKLEIKYNMIPSKYCKICKIEISKRFNRKYCEPCLEIRTYEREKEWRQSHPKESAIHSQKYRIKNLEYKKQKSREWAKANKELKRIYCQNRRALLKKNGGILTLEEWNSIKIEQENKCWDCGVECNLTIGHAIPICKGGRTEYINILGQCMPCNLKQGQQIHPTFKTYGSHSLIIKIAQVIADDNKDKEYWSNIEALVKKQYEKGLW
jgi:5-methylcytosine-specific restriction endonuclease McrA